MKARTLFVLCALFSAVTAFAQMPTGQWYIIHSEIVKPSMVKEYEAATRGFIDIVRANQATMPHFHFNAHQSDDFVYTYVLPIANMAAIDSVNADFKAMMTGPAASQFMAVMNQGNTAIEYTREWVVGESPELSYTPANPRLKPEEEKYFHLDIYYVKADKIMEVEPVAKEIAELCKKKNIPDGYKIYMSVMGPEMPALIVRIAAKDAADYRTENAKNQALLGDEFKALIHRAFAITRRFDTRESWLRPDLSNMPASK